MKKSNHTKIFFGVAIVLMVAGAICLGVGVAEGGSLHYVSIDRETASWWPFKDARLISFGFLDDTDEFDGISIASNSHKSTYTQDLQDVSSLHIDMDLGDIELVRGSENTVRFENIDKKYVDCKEENGSVTLKVDHPNSWSNSYNEKIIIELKDREYDLIEIENKLGELELEGIKAKKFHIVSKLGSVDLNDITSKDLYVEEKSGNIDIEGNLKGNSIIMNKMGETTVEINGNEKDYRLSVENKMGDTTILDNDYQGSVSITRGDEKAENFVKVESKMGDVEVDIH